MTPCHFDQANTKFHPPEDSEPGQVLPILGFRGEITSGELDGTPVIVTAWQPSPEERAQLAAGAPVYLMLLARELPAHALTVTFPIA